MPFPFHFIAMSQVSLMGREQTLHIATSCSEEDLSSSDGDDDRLQQKDNRAEEPTTNSDGETRCARYECKEGPFQDNPACS
jgi:hypothetical protein